jgi:glycosyltransferase involved in cell wall biosynthesis
MPRPYRSEGDLGLDDGHSGEEPYATAHSTEKLSKAPPYRPRIAFVTHSFAPSVGGAETHFGVAAASAASAGVVRVFASSLCVHSGSRLHMAKLRGTLEVNEVAVDVCYLPSTYLLNEKFILPDKLLSELLRFRPDIVWSSHPSASAIVVSIYAWLRRIKWVATYHADLASNGSLRRLFTKLESACLRRADLIQVTSEKYAERLVERGVSRTRIMVIPPFTWRSALGPGPALEPTDPKLQFGPQHPFLFVGALDEAHAYKHPSDLIAAAAKLKAAGIDAYVTLAGDGNAKHLLEALAHQLSVQSLVRFAGKVPIEELEQLYREAWALVVTSPDESEGFGIVILEALSHGCPVLSSDSVPGVNRFARGMGAVTYHGGNIDDLSRMAARLILESDFRRGLAEQARRLNLRGENEANQRTLLKAVISLLTTGASAEAGVSAAAT